MAHPIEFLTYEFLTYRQYRSRDLYTGYIPIAPNGAASVSKLNP
jgi:hypothetical protein